MTIEIKENKYLRAHPYPAVAHIVGRDQAGAIEALHCYVRPEGDYILVRSDLDTLDQAFRQLEEHIQAKWNGAMWSKR